MNRRQFLGMAAATVAVAQGKPPLNFVFILADDLGWADLGCYGADLHETPNLDRLAKESVRFTNAYAASPVCTPTRASIMTGKHPAKLHMTIWREAARRPPENRRVVPPVAEENLPHSEVTFAEVVKASGYHTAHIGKWHLGNAEHYPETQGFDINTGGSVWGAPQTFFWPYRGSKRFGGEYRYVPGLAGGKPGEYLTDRLTDEAMKALDMSGGRPFFLNLWYHTVHTPIEGKPELVAKYKARIRPEMRHKNAGYAAMVQSLDENVGRVLRKLEEMKVADRTVVVFTSDNGGYINEYEGQPCTDNYPLRSGKGSLYEGGVRAPLMIRGPMARAGLVVDEPVCSIDFYPTMLEMAGLQGDAQHNAGVDGLSLMPLLTGAGKRLPREELFFHYPHYYPTTTPVSAVRTREWKLLEYLEDGKLELYNLSEDPGESRDLAGQQVHRAAGLKAKLDAWRARVGAQMPARKGFSNK
jgi:arylsulfatase A-like enzyme